LKTVTASALNSTGLLESLQSYLLFGSFITCTHSSREYCCSEERSRILRGVSARAASRVGLVVVGGVGRAFGVLRFDCPNLLLWRVCGAVRFLLFGVEGTAVEVSIGDGEVNAIVCGQKDAKLACNEIGGVIGAEFSHEDVFREGRAACLYGDEGKDGGNCERQEGDGPFHCWILWAKLSSVMSGRS
jgi:hypothetical protein